MRLAVVIVTRNEPRLDACLESVLSQETDVPFEVVVVDNNSTPEFRQRIAAAWGNRRNVRILHVPGVFSAAWNEGAKATEADVIARIDSDAVAHPGWLRRLTRPFLERPEISWTGGPAYGPEPPRSLTQRYFHYRTLGYQKRLHGTVLPTDAVPSWNVAYRRSALEAVGGYDPWQRSSIDWDLHKRMSLRGFQGVFVPDAGITHDHPATLRDFYRKEAWYRTGHYQMSRKYGFAAVRESLLLPAAYLFLAIVAFLGFLDVRLAYAALVLFGLLVVKQWVGAALERDPLFLWRPAYRIIEALAAMHGLLRGVARYGVRRRPIPGVPPTP